MTAADKCWIAAVVALGAAILGSMFAGDQGLGEVRRLLAERRQLAADIERLKAEKTSLEARVADLASDRSVEARARKDQGMIREGETVFVLPEARGR